MQSGVQKKTGTKTINFMHKKTFGKANDGTMQPSLL